MLALKLNSLSLGWTVACKSLSNNMRTTHFMQEQVCTMEHHFKVPEVSTPGNSLLLLSLLIDRHKTQ